MKANLIPADASASQKASFSKIQELLGYAPKAQITTVYTGTSIGGTFTLTHTLGMRPTTVLALPYAQLDVWATQADRDTWTDSQITLRASVANTLVDLVILGL